MAGRAAPGGVRFRPRAHHITVEGTSSLAEQENGAWTVGPNPVNRGDVLAVRGLAGGTPMTVVDVQGRVVFEGAWTGDLR